MAFQKGVSGNPSGRVKSNLSKALSGYLQQEDPVTKKKHEQLIAERVVALAEGGDLDAIEFIFDRLEGKVATSVEGLPSGTTLRELVIG